MAVAGEAVFDVFVGEPAGAAVARAGGEAEAAFHFRVEAQGVRSSSNHVSTLRNRTANSLEADNGDEIGTGLRQEWQQVFK